MGHAIYWGFRRFIFLKATDQAEDNNYGAYHGCEVYFREWGSDAMNGDPMLMKKSQGNDPDTESTVKQGINRTEVMQVESAKQHNAGDETADEPTTGRSMECIPVVPEQRISISEPECR